MNENTKRVFVAICPDANITHRLESYQEHIPPENLRWTKLTNLHITLAFLGEVSELQLGSISGALSRIAKKVRPFVLSIEHIAAAPKLRSPDMIWARIHQSEQLSALVRDIRSTIEPLLSEASLRKLESFDFSPHITLARTTGSGTLPIAPFPQISDISHCEFTVDRLVLMETKRSREGADYHVREEYLLVD